MTDAETTVDATQQASEAQALADAQAGYERRTRGEQPPVTEVPTTEGSPAPAETAAATDEATPATADDDAPEQPQPSVADELAALKQRVQEMASASADPGEIRRLNGEIGNINRSIQQLQNTQNKGQAPAQPELDAVLRDAEAVAEEYPELAGPLVKAIKALQGNAAPAQPEDLDERISAAVQQQRQKDAMQALTEEHPDWLEFRQTDDYRQWLASKPAAFQKTFNETWNPATVAKGLSEAKAFVESRRRKQERRLAAVTPQGVGGPAANEQPSDEQAALSGYERARRRRI